MAHKRKGRHVVQKIVRFEEVTFPARKKGETIEKMNIFWQSPASWVTCTAPQILKLQQFLWDWLNYYHPDLVDRNVPTC